MAQIDRRKQSLYFSDQMLEEMRSEAARLDRSLSWVVHKAWKIARDRIAAMPSANDAPVGATADALPTGGRSALTVVVPAGGWARQCGAPRPRIEAQRAAEPAYIARLLERRKGRGS